jgi:hypothetical protein
MDPFTVTIAVVGAGAGVVGAAGTLAALAYPIAKDAVKAINKWEQDKVTYLTSISLHPHPSPSLSRSLFLAPRMSALL